MKKIITILASIILAAGLSACKTACPATNNTTAMVPPMPAKDRPQHVILVGFDGLSGKCIRDGIQAPTIRELMANGSYTLESRSILPSSSACNWASMFMGAGIEVHGYTVWNSKEPDLKARELTENGRFPDIFWAYKKKDPSAEIGYIYEWDGMNFVSDPAATDYRVNTPATNTVATAVNYIKEKKPNLCAIAFDNPDHAGHTYGWASPEYVASVAEMDNNLKQILSAVEAAGIMDETVIIVTSDHGGINKGHGGMTMDEMERPVVFYGKNIKKNFQITDSTMVYDIAPTIGYMFNVEPPQVWTGRPILSIFEKR